MGDYHLIDSDEEALLPRASAVDEEENEILGLGFAAPRQKSEARRKCVHYCKQEGGKVALLIIWGAVSIALFLERFLYYRFSPEVRPSAAFALMSYGVCLARAAANALKFNLMLVLLLACRNGVSFLMKVPLARALVPLHKSFVFHKWVALSIVVLTCMHVLGHISNAVKMHGATSIAQFGFATDPPTELPFQVMTTRAGITGVIAVVAMGIFFVLALQRFRRSLYERFAYSHFVGILVFYGALLAHGTLNLLEPPTFYLWFLAGAVPYLADRVARAIKTYHRVKVLSTTVMPGNVKRIVFEKPDRFRYGAGDYVRICVPEISRLQFHPFSLTSSNETSDTLELHINPAGDWTRELLELHPASLSVQGPFCTSTKEVMSGRFPVIMMVGGGIGVTPFASTLRTISARLANIMEGSSDTGGLAGGGDNLPLAYVEFVWSSRDASSFSWFEDLLNELGSRDRLVISTYDTSKKGKKGASPTHVTNGVVREGRPVWDEHFKRLKHYAGRRPIGVFACGSPGLCGALYKECRARDNVIFHKEVFG